MLHGSGRWSEALTLCRAAVGLARELFVVADGDVRRHLALDLADIQRMLQRRGCRIEAVQVAHDAATFHRAQAGTDDHAGVLAASLNTLASVLAGLGRHGEAATVTSEEVTLRRELARHGDVHCQHRLGIALRDLGRWLGRSGGDLKQVTGLIREALDILRPLAADGEFAARLDLARTCLALGTCLGDRGRASDALPAGLEAIALHRELARIDPARVASEHAKALHNVSIWLARTGRPVAAVAAAEEAVTMYRRLHEEAAGPDAQRDLAWSLVTLGNRLSDMQRHRQAQDAHREAGAMVLCLPADDARQWARLAGVPAATLALPQDLREFHLPLLRRLAGMASEACPEAAEAFARLQAQVADRTTTLLAGLPARLDNLLDEGVTALLEPLRGADVARWARAYGMGHRLLAVPYDWFGQRCRDE